MLQSLADDSLEWDEELPFVMAAYRASMLESTHCTPNLLMLGHEVSMAVDLMIGNASQPQHGTNCTIEYVEWLRDSLKDAHQRANEPEVCSQMTKD